MKGFLGFGAPKHRLCMQFSYDMRPSLWHRVKCNAHMVIAGAGTAALLSIAGGALWLAMPASERHAFAEPKQPVEIAAEPMVPTVAVSDAAAGGEIAPQAAEPPVLASNDPRWTDPKSKRTATAAQAPSAKAQAQQQAELAFVEPGSKAAIAAAAKAIVADDPKDASAASDDSDHVPTASISPDAPAATAINGHIVKAVTMRAGPKTGAAALRTLQAKTPVHVVSCKKWCQIVYEGKTGWVYGTYLRRDG